MNGRVLARAALGLLALAAASCTGGDELPVGLPGAGVADGTVTIGLLVPSSGALAPIAESLARPTRMAVDQMNAAGGVNGRPVRLEVADDGTSAEVAAASFDDLVGPGGVNVLVGPSGSSTALGLLARIRDRRLLTCSASATAPALDDADTGGWFVRTSPVDRPPAGLADVVAADGRRRVAVLARADATGTAAAAEVGRALLGRGVEAVPIGYGPALDVVARVRASRPEGLVLLGHNDDGAAVLAALIAGGVGPAALPTYLGDGLQSALAAQGLDPAVRASVRTAPGPAAATFAYTRSPFRAAFAATGVPVLHSAQSWDCANLLALAALRARSTDPERLRAALGENLAGDTDCDDFKSCKEALDSGRTIHYRGASDRFDHWTGTGPAAAVPERGSGQ
jgi:branched-chain amino acid transport system substrate-binding protein